VGKPVPADGMACRVIGVMPDDFIPATGAGNRASVVLLPARKFFSTARAHGGARWARRVGGGA